MQAVRWALSFYPPFYFSKGFYDVATRACSTVDAKEGKIIEGPGYSWSDLYVTRHVTFFKFHIKFHILTICFDAPRPAGSKDTFI